MGSFTASTATVTYAISGTITLSGSSLSGVTVTLGGSPSSSTTTDNSGRYSFSVAAGGSYTVTPSLRGYTFSPASQTFNNVTGDQTANFTAAAAPTGPAIAPNGVMSGASFQPGVVPNSWITILGTNLSSKTDTWDNAVVDGTLPTTLDGVTVTVGGQPAYIAYISPGQINALAPNTPAGSVAVTVSNAGATSSAVTAVAQMYQPAFFQWGHYAASTTTNYSPAVKNGTIPGLTTAPAKPGDTVILWGTGFGPTTPSAPTGIVAPANPVCYAASPVTITVGGVAANVQGVALSPGYGGLYQVAVQIPATLADGDYPVVATVSGARSPSSTLISVQGAGAPTAPKLNLSANTLAFGNVAVGQTKDMSLTLSNGGTVVLAIRSLNLNGVGFSLVSAGGPFTISPGSSQTATIRFSPIVTGTQNGTLTIASNDPNNPTVTVSLSASGVPPGTAVAGPVDISIAFNRTGVYTDGTTFPSTGGLDNNGYAYSAKALGGAASWNNSSFNFGPANAPDVVSAAGQSLALPAGRFFCLQFLATGVNGKQSGQAFTVKYTDGTSTTSTFDLDDWAKWSASNYSEGVAGEMTSRNQSNGSKNSGFYYLYGYTIFLDYTKTAASFSLPNNSNVEVLAVSMAYSIVGSQDTTSLPFNRIGIVSDGQKFGVGLDGQGYAYSSNLLGPVVSWSGNSFVLGTPNVVSDVVCASGQIVPLPSGKFSSLLMLAIGVNGNQPGQTFTITYSDGTTSTITQNLSDWATPQNYPQESTLANMPYRNFRDGTKRYSTIYLYGYAFTLDNTKTVASLTLPNNSSVVVLAVTLAGGSGSGQ